jgi:hypothetical protein
VERRKRIRTIEATLMGVVAIVGVFGGFRLLYVAAVMAVLVVAFTGNELWWAWHEANRQAEADTGGEDSTK